MRAMKRTVSVLLSLMLVLGMVTMGISVAGAAETNTITATSNIAAAVTQTYTAGSGQVTVSYSLQAGKRIVDGQGVITYDTNVLKLADSNTKSTFYPNMSGGMEVVNLDKTDGRIRSTSPTSIPMISAPPRFWSAWYLMLSAAATPPLTSTWIA